MLTATHEAPQALRDKNPQSFISITWPRLPAWEHRNRAHSMLLLRDSGPFATHRISAEMDKVKVLAPGLGSPPLCCLPGHRAVLPEGSSQALPSLGQDTRSDPRLVSDRSHITLCVISAVWLTRPATWSRGGPQDAPCLSFPGCKSRDGEH